MNWDQNQVHTENSHPASSQGLFCPNCGRTIQPSTSFCSHCRAAILRRYCPGCNRLVPDATQVCPYCATPANATPKTHQISSTSIGTGVAIVLCLFLVIQGIRTARVEQKTIATVPPLQTQLAVAKVDIPAAKQLTAPAQQNAIPADEATRLNIAGHELIKQKRFGEAVAVLEKAVKAFPPNSNAAAYPYALFNLGQALRLSGHPKDAISIMESCLKLLPNDENAKRELALDYQATSVAQIR